jgi:DNA-binding XRE family transcriptional regulator
MNTHKPTDGPQQQTTTAWAEVPDPTDSAVSSAAATSTGGTPGPEQVSTGPSSQLIGAVEPGMPEEVREMMRALSRQGRYNASGPLSREQRARQLINALKAARVRGGLTIVDVAARAGVHKSVIGKFENETTDPRLSTLLRYADAVNVDLVLAVEDRQFSLGSAGVEVGGGG